MTGADLAKALAAVARQRPDLDKALREHLKKWIKSALLKAPTLEALARLHSDGGTPIIAWHLEGMNDKELLTLAKKLDPHLPALSSQPPNALRSHIAGLASGRVAPSSKPEKQIKGKPVTRLAFADILKLSNGLHRRMELEKLSAAALKTGVRDLQLSSSSLSAKPSKIELIEHIQATISAGWPQNTSALDESKY